MLINEIDWLIYWFTDRPCVLQERDTLLMQFQDLKAQMSRLHNTEHQRLVKLTMLCDTALKDLRAKRAKVQYSTLYLQGVLFVAFFYMVV